MHIAAIQKTTLLDFPGKIACTVFLPGCNLRCPFCHNSGLVLPEEISPEYISIQSLLEFLKKRRGILDGVCITGGEPTIHKDLPQLISQIRNLGFAIKLDTNGTSPQVLQELIDRKLIDYAAMDIKNAPDQYQDICGGMDVIAQVHQSVQILMTGAVDFEFRTTVCHPYHTVQSMEAIGRWLQGEEKYFLQGFVDSGHLIGQNSSAFTDKEMKEILETVKQFIPHTQLRGI